METTFVWFYDCNKIDYLLLWCFFFSYLVKSIDRWHYHIEYWCWNIRMEFTKNEKRRVSIKNSETNASQCKPCTGKNVGFGFGCVNICNDHDYIETTTFNLKKTQLNELRTRKMLSKWWIYFFQLRYLRSVKKTECTWKCVDQKAHAGVFTE